MQEKKGAYFIIEKGAPYEKGTIIFIDKNPFHIGRPTGNQQLDIALISPFISRNHLDINHVHDSFQIIDTSSKHGTKINDAVIAKNEPKEIKHGDRIILANNEAILLFCSNIQPETIEYPSERPLIDIIFKEERHEVIIEGIKLELAGKTFALFQVLYRNKGRIVTHAEIKKAVWPERDCDTDGIALVGDEEITALMRRLRDKIGKYENLISNIRGYGYMLEVK